MRMGRRQKIITCILGAFLSLTCALLSGKLIMDKYERAKYSGENVQSVGSSSEDLALSATQRTNNGFWAEYSSDEIIGLILFAGFTVGVITFGFVWLISFAITFLTGGASKLSPTR